MDDGNMDLYDDSSFNGIGDSPDIDSGTPEPVNDQADNPVSSDSGDRSSVEASVDDDSGTDGQDGTDQETDGDTTTETEDGEKSEDAQTPEDGTENEEDPEGEETESVPVVDPEILMDIRDTLHNHSDSVSNFTSGLTVSGNVLQVSLDSGSTALLSESVDQQNKILNSMDCMAGLILLVFFVLVFDLIHRFAKRIIKNFMGGEKNGTNS